MAKWYEAANEASFKRLADGYVFQCPNPWVLARPRYYLVNETQKAQIFALMGRWRLLLLASLALSLAIPAGFAAFVHLAPRTFAHLVLPIVHGVGIGGFTVLLSLAMFLLMAPVVAAPHIYLNRGLRGPLAGAPRTNERITMKEQLPQTATAVSGKILAVGLGAGLLTMVAAVMGLIEDTAADGHLLRNLMFPYLPLMLLGGLLSAYFVYLIRLKSRLAPVAAQVP
jgi:hypothetical protein